jgi:hypothetical protein
MESNRNQKDKVHHGLLSPQKRRRMMKKEKEKELTELLCGDKLQTYTEIV